ncbi:unnamed protein product [Nippostrongylus brasiliensis]|uniref:Uncharacterized protein n=1 Tax=Nippostrongylus brasiliensis TaxID=27835 RepID=A0A158R320_NIPBR|nr:unnamed protein product [Nippostrongylus brasiliensis]
MTIIEEDLVRAEVRLQDMKDSAQPVSAPSGVAEGIMGAIRKTSGAFSNTFHMMAPALPELKVEIPQLPTAEHQRERRMSDVEHLWESSRKMHGF